MRQFFTLILIICFALPAQARTKDIMTITEMMIPMKDGVNLAIDLYMPADIKETDKLPVILEYSPYRKDDQRASRYSNYAYFVDRDFIVARVDIRGTGRSEGRLIPYEYSDIELDDGETVIAWLAKQSWSNGNIGMFGISWSGFNSIQLAVRQPPALKTFIALMATEALYHEDVHYIDGIIHTDSWMMSNDLTNSMPAGPDFQLDKNWLENRFNREPSVYTYMRHQRNGPFWDRASSLDKYDQIKIPSFHIGGWYDGYRNSLPRMLEHVKAPVKALIGPWDHMFPHNASPEPMMEWRHEATRWFNHWLRGVDTGIMDEPAMMVYTRHWYKADPALSYVPGKWRFEDGWPIKRTRYMSLFAGPDHSLHRTKPRASATHTLSYKASVGLEGGGPVMWWGSPTADQQPMDDHSLVYDSAPLSTDMEILGHVVAKLVVSSSAKQANWVVRISDVAPDGSVTQVAGGAINGTHRHSDRTPSYLPLNKKTPLKIKLHFSSWTFPKGHKIRVAISNAQWPMLWPTPFQMTTTLDVGGETSAELILPVIPKRQRADYPTPVIKESIHYPDPEGYKSIDDGNVSGYAEINEIMSDADTGEKYGFAKNAYSYQYPWGVEQFDEHLEHRTNDKNPAQTSVKGKYSIQLKLIDGRLLKLAQDVTFSSEKTHFKLKFIRQMYVNGTLAHSKTWDELIPRDFQ